MLVPLCIMISCSPRATRKLIYLLLVLSLLTRPMKASLIRVIICNPHSPAPSTPSCHPPLTARSALAEIAARADISAVKRRLSMNKYKPVWQGQKNVQLFLLGFPPPSLQFECAWLKVKMKKMQRIKIHSDYQERVEVNQPKACLSTTYQIPAAFNPT